MNRREAAIVAAYTGIAIGDFADTHAYIEEKLGRPVWTHEMVDPAIWEEIKAAAEADFVALKVEGMPDVD
jgi:hypothetical protein